MSKLVLLGPVFNLLKSVTDMRKIGAISSFFLFFLFYFIFFLIHNLQRYHFSSPLLGVEKKQVPLQSVLSHASIIHCPISQHFSVKL